MSSDLAQLVESERLPKEAADRLKDLQPDSFCFHRSWGVGRVKEWDVIEAQMVIDFKTKAGHVMAFEYAASSLRPVPANHIEAKILSDAAAVKALAAKDPAELMRGVVESLGKDATAEKIEAIFVPSIVPAEGWKKWWDGAKRAMKKDPHFTVPSRRNESIVLHDAPPDHKTNTLSAFKAAIGPKARVEALEQLGKHWRDVKDEAVAIEVIALVNETLAKVPRSQTELALELAFVRDEFIETSGLDTATYAVPPMANFVSPHPDQFGNTLNLLPTGKQARCLARSQKVFGLRWQENFLALLNTANSRTAEVIIESFRKENRQEEVFSAIERLIRERKLNPDLLMWLSKNRKGELKTLIGPQLFYAILGVLEFDQLSGSKKNGRLQDHLLSEKELVKDMLAPASDSEVRDLTRTILLTPIFEELDKRSLLATIIKLYPFVQGMIVGDGGNNKSDTVMVSWESLEKRRQELEDTVNKKIPENSRDIAVARSYGDLRENHEFKAAKEMQNVLMRRKAELEVMLASAQGTDFKGVATTEVNVGTIVSLKEAGTGRLQEYTVLGAWDSDPEKGIISYLTPVAKALSKKKVGETVELALENGKTSKVTVESIKAFNP
jgi:transcription elongation GreA/GreB family factor